MVHTQNSNQTCLRNAISVESTQLPYITLYLIACLSQDKVSKCGLVPDNLGLMACMPVLHTIFFPSHWVVSYKSIVKTKVRGVRGSNPVAIAIINPPKQIA